MHFSNTCSCPVQTAPPQQSVFLLSVAVFPSVVPFFFLSFSRSISPSLHSSQEESQFIGHRKELSWWQHQIEENICQKLNSGLAPFVLLFSRSTPSPKPRWVNWDLDCTWKQQKSCQHWLPGTRSTQNVSNIAWRHKQHDAGIIIRNVFLLLTSFHNRESRSHFVFTKYWCLINHKRQWMQTRELFLTELKEPKYCQGDLWIPHYPSLLWLPKLHQWFPWQLKGFAFPALHPESCVLINCEGALRFHNLDFLPFSLVNNSLCEKATSWRFYQFVSSCLTRRSWVSVQRLRQLDKIRILKNGNPVLFIQDTNEFWQMIGTP